MVLPHKGSKGDDYVGMVSCLKDWEFPLYRARALDMFARKGEFRSVDYADEVEALEAWEIHPPFAKIFKTNHPHAQVVCCESIQGIADARGVGRTWDMIVADHPMREFGHSWCEHFDFLEDAFYCLTPTNESVIVFNVAQEAVVDNVEVRARRSEWYQTEDKRLSMNFLVDFYDVFFASRGGDTKTSAYILHTSERATYWIAVYHFGGRSELCHDRFLLSGITAPGLPV